MTKRLILLSLSIATLYSCKDDSSLDSTQASQDHLFAERIFNDIGRVVEDGFIENNQNKDCPTYIIHNVNDTDEDTMIINFGDGTPACISYGNIKSGKIIALYNGKYRDSLSVITTSFDDYYVNNNLVQGTQIVTNEGRNDDGNILFSVEVIEASINTSNGVIEWESDFEKEWISGSETYDITDDQYIITGEANGIGRNDNSFSAEIEEDLNIDLACLPSCVIKSGTVKIAPSEYAERIINYGDSICDCDFYIDVNGSSYFITIN